CIPMKRKLSGSEASSPEGVGQSSVDEQAQPSSTLELEQGAVSAEARGFILEPNLALSLGMRPGEMIFRSMFYGSPQASNVSVLVNQLLEKQEELFNCGPGEGTSSGTHYNTLKTLSLIESNAAAIQALMDSVEAPTSCLYSPSSFSSSRLFPPLYIALPSLPLPVSVLPPPLPPVPHFHLLSSFCRFPFSS
ncbi:hypothetical protein, partial [Candidatus Ichthyocystis sparus]|uniref:hypothetical protein n=1 Tax=Candidatus Ichthyocystis sparus TaxID=1561004 RepID=UPI00159EC7BA